MYKYRVLTIVGYHGVGQVRFLYYWQDLTTDVHMKNGCFSDMDEKYLVLKSTKMVRVFSILNA